MSLPIERLSDAPDFDTRLRRAGQAPLRRARTTTLQVNLGLRCNLACHHCHVESGPKRTEALDARGVDRLLVLLERSPDVDTLDLTGGAPEMHPDFRRLVSGARTLGRRVIDRCNLTILHEPGQEDTATFLAEQGVDVVASLPCYSLENVEAQRGRGVFDGSVRALQALNALGYGHGALKLDLVYNPVGPSLPPPQATLEADYREALQREFGIVFDALLTITNMPIKRFADQLYKQGKLSEYMQLLVDNFNDETVPSTMCRSLVSVRWDGVMYDCDFNYALEMPHGLGRPITSITSLESLHDKPITTGSHCFGCTAGAGSS